MAKGKNESEHEELRKPAQLAAGLAKWIGKQDRTELQASFRRVGLDLYKAKPEHHYVHAYYGRGADKLRSGLHDDEFLTLAREVWDEGRTSLYYNRLYALYQAVRSVARQFPSEELRFLETGAYQGGSAKFLARAADRFGSNRISLTVIDTFSGHSEKDLPEGQEGVHTTAKFTDTSVDSVREYLSEFEFVDVLEGRAQDVFPTLDEGDLHFVHSDVDLFKPTRATLDFFAERTAPGAIAVVDDFGFTTCPGVKRAVDGFSSDHSERFVVHALDSGQALAVRTR